MNNKPLLSVILPVYNSEKFLKESIDSILNQTFTDFELIIINDGSNDKSSQIIKEYSDHRIRYVDQMNLGLAKTLNKGLDLARGKYIARQDADDISDFRRFEKQIQYLECNPDLVLIGSWATIIDENGNDTFRVHKHPVKREFLKLELVFDNPFVHSTIIFRKDSIVKIGGYVISDDIFEDHNLWSRVSYEFHVSNLPQELLRYREVQLGISKSSSNYLNKVLNQCEQNLNVYLPNQKELNSQIASLFHAVDLSKNKNEIILLKETIYKLIEIILENESPFTKRQMRNLLFLRFKMNRLRTIITSASLNFFERIWLKIKRRYLLARINSISKIEFPNSL